MSKQAWCPESGKAVPTPNSIRPIRRVECKCGRSISVHRASRGGALVLIYQNHRLPSPATLRKIREARQRAESSG